MATSWTPTSAGSAADLRPEEEAFLAGGPGRAAEVAVVSLVESGAVRISRAGLVSAVHAPHRSWTPLQASALQSLPRKLGEVITWTARGAEADGLRSHLVERGFVRPSARRSKVLTARRVLVFGGIAIVALGIGDVLEFGTIAAALFCTVLLAVLVGRAARPLTASGRAAVKRLGGVATTNNRLAMVAFHGLLGKVEGHLVWEVLGMAPAAAATLQRRRRGDNANGSASCGGGCGSCSSNSCGSASGTDGGSSSSCSSSGSSCGSGCGGGGGD
ncbi:TIGR04222 domain-containing membrane protein [Actinosynnema sp. NPDC023587]|uniref:TIGR04222 domain-containing membrane protein n=1 Tax=Actinosynnema sp. NPDC023587 TaxID=3154695 RepID=UPI00340806C0